MSFQDFRISTTFRYFCLPHHYDEILPKSFQRFFLPIPFRDFHLPKCFSFPTTDLVQSTSYRYPSNQSFFFAAVFSKFPPTDKFLRFPLENLPTSLKKMLKKYLVQCTLCPNFKNQFRDFRLPTYFCKPPDDFYKNAEK